MGIINSGVLIVCQLFSFRVELPLGLVEQGLVFAVNFLVVGRDGFYIE